MKACRLPAESSGALVQVQVSVLTIYTKPLTRVDGIGATYYPYNVVGQSLSEGGLGRDDAVNYIFNNRLLAISVFQLFAKVVSYKKIRRLILTGHPSKC